MEEKASGVTEIVTTTPILARSRVNTRLTTWALAANAEQGFQAGMPSWAAALGPSEARFRVLAYAVQSMAPAGFAVPQRPFPFPIPPRCESGRHHDRCPEGRKQCDHHCDDRDKGFGHQDSPNLRADAPPQ
jgi:hypothetical protein